MSVKVLILIDVEWCVHELTRLFVPHLGRVVKVWHYYSDESIVTLDLCVLNSNDEIFSDIICDWAL